MRADAADTGPPRPRRAVRALEHALALLPAPRLDPERLADHARSASGLSDFGEPSALVALERLCHSLEHDVELTALGRVVAKSVVTDALVNRLRITAELTLHPEILDESVPAPIVIIGLPRTGTSLLQRTLAAHPALRSPQWWEMSRPCPPAGHHPDTVPSRIREAERAVRLTTFVVPDLQAIHPTDATTADECLVLMGNDLTSLSFVLPFDVPGYLAWLESTDLSVAYRNHRRQLQLLQWGTASRRWLLKSPGHLFALPALLSAYPDAVVVQTHRDPLEVVPSTASLLAHAQAPFVRSSRPDELGRRVTAILGRWTARFAEDRQAARRDPANRATFLDVEYRDLVARPLEVVEQVLAFADVKPSPAGIAAMQDHLRQNPQHHRGPHRYALADYGLDAERVRTSVPGRIPAVSGNGNAPRVERA